MKLWLLPFLIFLISCGEELGDNKTSRPDDTEIPEGEEAVEFSTRLTNNLLIAGRQCDGVEQASDANGTMVTCARDQWLITVDNVNTCYAGGACTQTNVIPFVAELVRTDRTTTANAAYYEISPISIITPDKQSVIDKYLVRMHASDGTASVVPK